MVYVSRGMQEAREDAYRRTRRKVVADVASLAGVTLAGVARHRLGHKGGLGDGKFRIAQVVSSATVPVQVDVVAIGGGNVGCSTAEEFADRRLRVAICEKDVIAGDAFGRSLGYVDGLNMPVISVVSKIPGMLIGWSFHYELTMARAAGEALTDPMTDRKPRFDLTNCRLSRVSDSSSIIFCA